jgi:hypothetical protein
VYFSAVIFFPPRVGFLPARTARRPPWRNQRFARRLSKAAMRESTIANSSHRAAICRHPLNRLHADIGRSGAVLNFMLQTTSLGHEQFGALVGWHLGELVQLLANLHQSRNNLNPFLDVHDRSLSPTADRMTHLRLNS